MLDGVSPDTPITRLALHPDDPQKVYALGYAGVFYSEDGGTTWDQVGRNLQSRRLYLLLRARLCPGRSADDVRRHLRRRHHQVGGRWPQLVRGQRPAPPGRRAGQQLRHGPRPNRPRHDVRHHHRRHIQDDGRRRDVALYRSGRLSAPAPDRDRPHRSRSACTWAATAKTFTPATTAARPGRQVPLPAAARSEAPSCSRRAPTSSFRPSPSIPSVPTGSWSPCTARPTPRCSAPPITARRGRHRRWAFRPRPTPWPSTPPSPARSMPAWAGSRASRAWSAPTTAA